MTAALKYMRRMSDRMFENQMQCVAVKICERQKYFRRRPVSDAHAPSLSANSSRLLTA